MKSFSIFTPLLVRALLQALVITLIISGCGASQATPTINVIDLQNTLVSDVGTMFAETHVAIPTATLTLTPPPPTATVTATETPTAAAELPSLPTAGPTFTALPVGIAGTADPCITQVIPGSLQGFPIKIRIDNPTTVTLMLSVNLQKSANQSQCGYRIYTLDPRGSLVISDLVEGCYTLWAWNPDPHDYFIVTNGTSCLDISNSWTFDISTNDIRLRP